MEDGGPPGPGGPLTGALTAALVNGLEWSKTETAMEALVLAPVYPRDIKVWVKKQTHTHKKINNYASNAKLN